MEPKRSDKKKIIERAAVLFFLNHQGIEFNEADIISGEENSPVDVTYRGMNFQIITVPFEVEEVVGKLNKEEEVKSGNTEGKWILCGRTRIKTWSSGYNIEESLRVFILNPIEKKLKQYGNKSTPESLKDIILLIYCPNLCVTPWNDELWEEYKKSQSGYFTKTGFQSIHLIDSGRDIKIYEKGVNLNLSH